MRQNGRIMQKSLPSIGRQGFFFKRKGEGQQFFLSHDAALSREVGENDALDGKFGDDLAARAAR